MPLPGVFPDGSHVCDLLPDRINAVVKSAIVTSNRYEPVVRIIFKGQGQSRKARLSRIVPYQTQQQVISVLAVPYK